MTTSRHELVASGFLTQMGLVNTQVAGGGGTVTLARNVDDAIKVDRALVMVDGGYEKNPESLGEVMGQDRYLRRFAVFGYCRAATDALLAAAINDLNARLVKAILTDPTLGGVAEYTWERSQDNPDWDDEKGRRPNASFTVHFETEYVTKQGDPFSLPG